MRCEICGKSPSETHEFLSRGRWGKAALIPENQIELCDDHHRLSGKAVHRMGVDSFTREFGFTERLEKACQAVWGQSG